MAAVVIITFAVCITLAMAQKSRQSNVICPQPLCADPVIQPGESCPSCSKSQCMFRGYIQYEPNQKVTWMPDPCMRCRCYRGREICAMYGCNGYPETANQCLNSGPLTKLGYRPYVCCPRCDFGVPEQACLAVPSKWKSFSTMNGHGNRCSGTAIEYKCDKAGYRKGGKKFRCVEERRRSKLNLTGFRCKPMSYYGVVSCKAVEDPTLKRAEGCDMYIHS